MDKENINYATDTTWENVHVALDVNSITDVGFVRNSDMVLHCVENQVLVVMIMTKISTILIPGMTQTKGVVKEEGGDNKCISI